MSKEKGMIPSFDADADFDLVTSPGTPTPTRSHEVTHCQANGQRPEDPRPVAFPSECSNRPFLQRAVGEMTMGGVRQSVLTLTSTALGGGVLAVSYTVSLVGVGLGVALLFCGAALSYLGTVILMRASVETGCDTFSKLFSHCIGPNGGPVLDLMLFIYGNGACVGYFVFLSDFIPGLIKLGHDVPSWMVDRKFAILLSLVIVLPMAVQQNLSALRHFTLLSIVSLIYAAMVVVVLTPAHHQENQELFGPIKVVSFNKHIFEAFAMCLFAYNCHLNTVPTAVGLVRPTKQRIRKVSWRINAVQFTFYSFIGVAGYVSFLSNTPQDVMEGYGATNVPIAIARILLTCSMFVAIPLNAHPTVQSGLHLIEFFMKGDVALTAASPQPTPPSSPRVSGEMSGDFDRPAIAPGWPRMLLAVVCLTIQAGIAVVVPGVADVIGLLGATIATAMMLVIPAHTLGVVLPNSRGLRVQQFVLYAFSLVAIVSIPIKIMKMV